MSDPWIFSTKISLLGDWFASFLVGDTDDDDDANWTDKTEILNIQRSVGASQARGK